MGEHNQMDKDFWLNFDKVIEQTTVPRFSPNTVRPCAEEDFSDFKKTLSSNLHNIISFLNIILKNKDQIENKKKLVKVITIIGEQGSNNVWNTSETVEVSKSITLLVCQIFRKDNVSEIFDDDIFMDVILYLRPKLLKDTWKSYPGAVVCYKWLLGIIEKPFLKRHITEVLPTALIIFDDYVPENQMLGLECIGIIIDHCEKSKNLRNLNYDEVIFQALAKATHNVETNMIILLYTCITKLLENIHYCEDNMFAWSRQDHILSILLDKMELQSDGDCRYAYIVSLRGFLNHSSIGRWSERLTRILCEYCENYTNLKNISASLDLVKAFISIYRPRAINLYLAMYCSLLKLCCKYENTGERGKEIMEKTKQCVTLLNELCPHLSREVMANDTIKSFIDELFKSDG